MARHSGIPVKSITLIIFGGIAKLGKEAEKAGVELKIALAGPASSLAIAAACALLWFFTEDTNDYVSGVAIWMAEVNGSLAVFNLIPGFPLDGGRVFRSVAWRVTHNYGGSTRIAVRMWQGIGYLFIVGGFLIMFYLHRWIDGLLLAFIGWFLQNTALSSYRDFKYQGKLKGFPDSWSPRLPSAVVLA